MSKGLIDEYVEEERMRMMSGLRNAGLHNLIANPAQSTITNSVGASLGQAGAYKDRGVVGDFRIEQVHGGFIVCIGREPYGPAERHIAITMEDVSRIVLSQLASSMLEKT